MTNKRILALLCGGQSVEHSISLLSAQNVLKAIDKQRYDVVLIGIDQETGHFIQQKDITAFLDQPSDPQHICLQTHAPQGVFFNPKKGETAFKTVYGEESDIIPIDVVFPLVHGHTGEDGALQGLLTLLNVPYIGSDSLGCAITMDKAVTKTLLQAYNLPTAPFISLQKSAPIDNALIEKTIGFPCFVKPANLGSSVGITRVTHPDKLPQAIAEAFLYDHKILVEKAIVGRELECAVLGNDRARASNIGEIRTLSDSSADFYDYQAKYLNKKTVTLDIPAQNLTQETIQQIQSLAVATFKRLGCAGMARVDFFMNAQGELFVNEVNTIPGFTEISMYPTLWQISGIPYTQLIDRLIDLAFQRHKSTQSLRRQL